MGGEPVERADDVQRLMNDAVIGRPISVGLLRGERWLELELHPTELVE